MPNVLVPNVKEAFTQGKAFVSSIGIIPTIVIALVIVGVLFLAFDSGSNFIRSTVAAKRISDLEASAAEDKARVAKAEAEAEQFKGAAAAYKDQSAEMQAQVTELINARPELQQRVATAAARTQAARNRVPQPIDAHIDERVKVFGAKLDQLYPDR